MIYNVWIESPKGKWCQLCVPSKSWRFYYHMLNQFLSYIYSPYLSPSQYHGFIYNCGCKSWWESLLWSSLFTRYNSLMELDFSSGFPNLSLYYVEQALKDDNLLPLTLINQILYHLKSPLQASSHFPTLETFIENRLNQSWQKGDRSVPMGIGISLILFVITLHWSLRSSKFLTYSWTSKWYVDDRSIFMNLKDLLPILTKEGKSILWILKTILTGRNPIVSLINDHPLYQEVGLRVCPKKSSWVHLIKVWIKSFKSLGLCLYSSQSIPAQLLHLLLDQPILLQLSGNTKDRGENTKTHRPGTQGSQTPLSSLRISNSRYLSLNWVLLTFKHYFGLIQSRLYASKRTPLSYTAPSCTLHHSKKWGTYERKSILGRIIRRWKYYHPKEPLPQNLNIITAEKLLMEKLIEVNLLNPKDEKWSQLYPNYARELKLPSILLSQVLYGQTKSPLISRSWVPTDNYFHKIGEINLKPYELDTLKKEYSLQSNWGTLEFPLK